jgi:2-methylaconitate cis-trans-isomerase PrpF/2-methylcitrate dehydratase PrpD
MAPTPNPRSVPATYIRGGTSKAVFFHEKYIPPPGPGRDKFLIRIMGSPDPMQIDGIGGTHIVTSKTAIIKPSERDDADVDYTFAQVSIDTATVDYKGNCGNISAGVGPFAVNEGLLKGFKDAEEKPGVMKVRIYNTGSKKILISHVPINNETGRALEKGDYEIAGCPGTGAAIFMDYSLVTGATLGRGVLPTGRASETISLGDKSIKISVCDVANIMVFATAADLGIAGNEKPAAINSDMELIARVKEVRGKGAQLTGMCTDWQNVDKESPMLPMVALVSSPTNRNGHVQSRLFLDNRCHTTMAGTGGVCTAACSRVFGSVVHSVMGLKHIKADSLQIQHPSGILPVSVATESTKDESVPTFKSLSFVRTARYIFKGELMVPEDLPNVWSEPALTNGHAASNGVNGHEGHTSPYEAEPEAVTTKLAKFIENFKPENMKPEMYEKTRELILDILGVSILGSAVAESSAPFTKAVETLTRGFPGTNTVFGTSKTFPAPYAAMLNAAFAHTLDFDDTHIRGVGHPGAPVVATALAEAECKAAISFNDVLQAITLGYEINVRISSGLGPGGYERGFHNTGTSGIFGAIAALCKLRGLSANVIENAFGLALTYSSGTMQWLENGSWNKRLNPGNAAFNAFNAVAFAEAGALGAAKAIEGKFGFLTAYTNTPSVKLITEQLAEKWFYLDTALKPFPACRLTHAHIELAAELAESNKGRIVKEIRIGMDKKTVPIVGEPLPNKIHPTNIVEAQFSVYYQTAASWLCGSTLGWSVYDHLDDPKIHELCEKVIVEPQDLPSMVYTTMEATWEDGTKEERILVGPQWEGDRMPSYEGIKQKFVGNVSDVLGGKRTEQLAGYIKSSEAEPMDKFFELLSLSSAFDRSGSD